MREYFCAYHSMLDATRKLSDAEVGRLFRGLLHYSATGEQPENLQGREEIVFDIFSQQIDREAAKYESKCKQLSANGSRSKQMLANRTQEKEKDKDKEEDKDKGESITRARTRFTPPTADDVRDYAREKGWTDAQFSAERFVDFYASKGWKVGKEPMRDWKAAARGWVSRDDGGRGKTQFDRRPQDNPVLHYQQREYSAEDDDKLFINLDEYLKEG